MRICDPPEQQYSVTGMPQSTWCLLWTVVAVVVASEDRLGSEYTQTQTVVILSILVVLFASLIVHILTR